MKGNSLNIPEKMEEGHTPKCAESKAKTANSAYKGMVLALCSGFTFASVGLMVKVLGGRGYHVFTLGLFRFTGMFLFSFPLLFIPKGDGRKTNVFSLFEPIWPVWKDKKKAILLLTLLARAFVGFGAIMCHFKAIQHIPVSDAMTIGASSTIFVAIGGHIFLKEKCGIIPILCGLLTLFGVGVIARPPILTGEKSFDTDALIGTLFATSRMILTSVAIVFVRRLKILDASLIVVVIGGLQLAQNVGVGCFLGVFSFPTINENPYEGLKEWGLLGGVGILSFASQMALTVALKCEQAAAFAIVRTSSDTVFAFILQFIFLQMQPDAYSIVGAIIVLGAVGLIMGRKWVDSLPIEDDRRKKYSILLK